MKNGDSSKTKVQFDDDGDLIRDDGQQEIVFKINTVNEIGVLRKTVQIIYFTSLFHPKACLRIFEIVFSDTIYAT